MGRASNNGKITGSTTQTLPHPINSTVRLELEPNTNLSSIQESNIMVSSNQPPISLPINHPQPTDSNAQITTTNVILDYLLFLSINARIDQTKNELLKDVANDQHLSSFPNKKGQGIEAIVEGLLQSHRTQASSMLLPLPLKHRLYLCQLLHLVFDRSQIAISGSSPLKSSQVTQISTNTSKLPSPSQSANPTINTNTINTTNTTNTTSTINKASTTNTINTTIMTTTTNTINTSRNNNSLQKQRAQKLPTNLTKYEKHFKNALLSRCRKHRQSICAECQQHPSNSSITPPMTRRRSTPPKPIPTRRTAPGLIDAIPVFLNTCAITYRLARDNEPMTVKPMWYELLLDLLTQAAIECYLCDSYKSIDALLEVFSYGDIDPSDYHSDDSESDDDDDPHFAATRADDYLLWQRTAYLDEFRQKKKERMEEFLNVKGKLEQHFENLANKYPIRKFETDMLNYCADVTGSLETPALMTGHKIHRSNNELSSELFHIPGRYYGGIDIPMSDDDYYDDNIESINYNCNGNPSQSENNNNMDGKKRRLSESNKSKEMIKKTKSEEISLQ